MFQNNNNAVIKHISKAYLKSDKMRNYLAGTVIVLAAFLLTFASTFAYNASMELKNFTHYQALFESAGTHVTEMLRENPDVEVYGISKQVGVAKNKNVSLSLLYADDNTMELSNVRIKTGILPDQANQIALENGYLESAYPGTEIGDVISLTYRNHVNREMQTSKFIITGILETGAANDMNRKSYNAIVSKAFVDSDPVLSSTYPSVVIKISDSDRYSNEELKSKIKEIGRSAGLPEESININNLNVNSNNASSEVSYVVFAISLVIVMACALVIYNIFYITVISKVKEYGQLRTLGTTKRQIRKILMREGKLLSIKYIPIGILSGCGISYLLRPSMWLMLPSLILALCAGVITYFTIMLSLRKPAKIASGISPIEAIKYTTFYKGLKKEKNSVKKLTPSMLGRIYLTVNKKKTAITFLSLTLSGILFVSAASLLSSVNPAKRAGQEFPYGGEYMIHLNRDLLSGSTSYNELQIDNPLSDELNARIGAINGIDGVEIHKYIRGKLLGINHDDETISIDNIRKNDTTTFKKYLIKGNLPDLSSDQILINCASSTYEYFGLNCLPGDKITMILYDENAQITQDFTISGLIKNKDSGDTFFLPDSVMDTLTAQNCNISFEILSDQGYSSDVEARLKKLITSEEKLEFISMKEQTQLYTDTFRMIDVTVYTFVALIACFGLVNFINTIITNILSRKNEIGIMQAVGLSKKQLMIMLNTENAYLIFGSFILSIIAGSILGYFICETASNIGGLSYIQYQFPSWIIAGYFLAVITLQAVTIKFIGISMKKQSVVERLRKI